MSVKRTRDPAGLLPGRVHVNFSTPPTGDEMSAALSSLAAASPSGRIERLREHAELVALADELAARLASLGGNADWQLLDDIKTAEMRALYVAAAPAATEKRRRLKASASRLSDADIEVAVKSHKTQAEAAACLGLTDRQLRTRLKQIENRKA